MHSVLMFYASLKQLDIEFMRRLHTKVNLIPIIAKADTLTDEEVAEFKERVSRWMDSSLSVLFLYLFVDIGRHRPPQHPYLPGTHLR
jgi:septin family protein